MQLKFDILSLLSVNAVIIYLKIRKNSPTNLPEITREKIGFFRGNGCYCPLRPLPPVTTSLDGFTVPSVQHATCVKFPKSIYSFAVILYYKSERTFLLPSNDEIVSL